MKSSEPSPNADTSAGCESNQPAPGEEVEPRPTRCGKPVSPALPLAVGLSIGALVAFFFAPGSSLGHLPDTMMLGGLAAVLSTIGAWRALNAADDSQAVWICVRWNMIPPTLVFLPTVFGLIFAVPAGFIATVISMIPVLAARRSDVSHTSAAGGRLLGLTALALVCPTALGTATTEHVVICSATAVVALAWLVVAAAARLVAERSDEARE